MKTHYHSPGPLYSHWCHAVSLFLLALGPQSAPAATNTPALAANDWRQLWDQEGHDSWHNKSEAELLRLADQGHPAAQFLLWQNWRRTQKEKAKAMLDSAAKAGLAQAVFEIGFSEFIDYQTTREKRLAGWALMEQAAETGYPYARLQMAEYETGRISSDRLVKPNLKRALEFIRDSADAGYAGAMVDLALLYSSGVGEPRGASDTPHNLLIAAAKKGSTGAMSHLSDRYALGHGETVDPLEAARLRFFAGGYGPSLVPGSQLVDAESNPIAQDTVAMDDLARALSLFIKAGEHKNAAAAATLAERYLEAGKPGQAFVLFTFAEQLGSATASAQLKKLQSAVTAEQRANAAKLFPFISM